MNSYERLMNRIKGQPVDRIPNFDIMMTFAAHYVGQPLSRYYQDYRVLCDANFAVQERFSLDIVQAISDPYREAYDFGAEIEFPQDGLPVCKSPVLIEFSELRKIVPPNPYKGRRMSDRLEALKLFRKQVGGKVPIMGWVEGALAEAADLRGTAKLLMDLYDRPGWVEDLLKVCVEVEIAFAKAQVESGADIIGLGDAIASQVGPKAYREFALSYEQQIFAAVHEMGVLCRLHICGDTTQILTDMAESGADIIDIDWMVDMRQAAEAFGERAVVCGNMNPVGVMLQGTPEQVRDSTLDCVKQGGQRCIVAAGCEIPDGTPHENLFAQAGILKEAVS